MAGRLVNAHSLREVPGAFGSRGDDGWYAVSLEFRGRHQWRQSLSVRNVDLRQRCFRPKIRWLAKAVVNAATGRTPHKGKACEDNRRDRRDRRDLRTAARFVTSATRDENRRGLRNAACFVTSANRNDNRRDLATATRDENRRGLRTGACFVTSAGGDDNRRDLGTTTRGLARSKGKAWGLG